MSYVRIRTCTAASSITENDLILPIINLTTVGDLQNMIYEKLNIELPRQKLYYGGKELISDHYVIDYHVRCNDVIQLIVRSYGQQLKDVSIKNENKKTDEQIIQAKSNYYKIGDCIDVIYKELGAWFEAKIVNIFTVQNDSYTEQDLIFEIVMDRNEKTAPLSVKFHDIRPRSNYIYKRSELKIGMVVLVNYNIQNPKEIGYWYDLKVATITDATLAGILLMGQNHEELHDCLIEFKDEVMKIEKPMLLTERTSKEYHNIPWRKLPLYCNVCRDVSTKNCKECSCNVCGKKNHIDALIICDECDCTYHLFCLNPPLSDIPPESEWYCPDCKIDENEIVKPGEKLKVNSSSFIETSERRTIIPKSYFGPIPNVNVGTCWKSQMQVFESGVHCTHTGIHVSENNGVYSIILGDRNIEDIIDKGEEFYYTEISRSYLPENGKISIQTAKQLTKINKALALNCNTKVQSDGFGKAEDWRNGKPIRVVRNYILGTTSKFAPKTGYRYDGIYKIVEYFPDLNRYNKLVWRYLLRRDDLAPPPWTENNQEFKLNISSCSNKNPCKKLKTQPFHISAELEMFIKEDFANEKIWNECRHFATGGKKTFLEKVEELFICVCCYDIVSEPVTIQCTHNICKTCLMKCFAAEIYYCPRCRYEIGENYLIVINHNLKAALKILFPLNQNNCY